MIFIFKNISNNRSHSKYQYKLCYFFNIILLIYGIFKHSRPTVGAASNSVIDCWCSFDAESTGVMTSRRYGVEGNSVLDCTQNYGTSDAQFSLRVKLGNLQFQCIHVQES